MAKYQSFDSSSSLQIEVREGEGSGGNSYATELSKAIPVLIAAIQRALAAVPSEQRPKELSVTTHLHALERGGFAIAQGAQAASIIATLVWKGGDDGGATMPTIGSE